MTIERDSRGAPGVHSSAPKPIPKVATRIRGLDRILEGGLPEGGITLANRGPGSGKTLLALEFLYPLLSGGSIRGSCVLVAGMSGTGKAAPARTFVAESRRQEAGR